MTAITSEVSKAISTERERKESTQGGFFSRGQESQAEPKKSLYQRFIG